MLLSVSYDIGIGSQMSGVQSTRKMIKILLIVVIVVLITISEFNLTMFAVYTYPLGDYPEIFVGRQNVAPCPVGD